MTSQMCLHDSYLICVHCCCCVCGVCVLRRSPSAVTKVSILAARKPKVENTSTHKHILSGARTNHKLWCMHIAFKGMGVGDVVILIKLCGFLLFFLPFSPLIQSQLVSVVGLRSYSDVLSLMQLARSELLEIISAIEFWDRQSMDLVLKHVPSQKQKPTHRHTHTHTHRGMCASYCSYFVHLPYSSLHPRFFFLPRYS